MFQAELPRSVHLEKFLDTAMKTTASGRKLLAPLSKVSAAARVSPSPKTREEWKAHMWHSVLKTGIHEHKFTCRKPPMGRVQCRTGYQQALVEKTGCCELTLTAEDQEELESPTGEKPISKIVPVSQRSPAMNQNQANAMS